MVVYQILTFEYDLPLSKLLDRRMRDLDNAYSLEAVPDGVLLKVRGESPERAAAYALSRVLGRDLRYFALAELTDALPLSLSEKQAVLSDALDAASAHEEPAVLIAKLEDYLGAQHTVCLEGFLRFRMQEFLMLWEIAVEQAAANVLMQKEYGEPRALAFGVHPSGRHDHALGRRRRAHRVCGLRAGRDFAATRQHGAGKADRLRPLRRRKKSPRGGDCQGLRRPGEAVPVNALR